MTALRDISERKRAEERIQFLAHHDHLTGLPNRVLLDERLRQALEAAVTTDGSYAVHCMDLDRFKSINDVFGHPAGDRLLVFAAERLRAAVRASDTLARTGGDEFVVVQPGAGRAEAASLARRLVSVLSQGIQIEGRSVSVGTSVGVALYPADGTTGERLLRHADTALYRAKREGRGTFRFFEEATDGRMQERHALEQDLGEALALGQLDLHYQPIVDCPTGRLVGLKPSPGGTTPYAVLSLPPSSCLSRRSAASFCRLAAGRWRPPAQRPLHGRPKPALRSISLLRSSASPGCRSLSQMCCAVPAFPQTDSNSK